MKNIKYKILLPALLVLVMALMTSCTENFEEFNQDTNAITDKQLDADFNSIGAFYPNIQNNIYPSLNTAAIPGDVLHIQQGAWAGYMMITTPGDYSCNYLLPYNNWEPYSMFGVAYNSVLSPINELKRRGAETKSPDFWAIALIMRVATIQGITNTYGPTPYSKFGQGGTTVAYDSQQQIYNSFFTELDQATSALKKFIAASPSARPFAKFDLIYGGDYTKWLRYANTLRLQLAMNLVKVDPAKAKQEAEKAVDAANGGVITTNAHNALVTKGLNIHALSQLEWGDTRVNAAIISYMNGYNDPRREKYFETSRIVPGQYVGLRTGSAYASITEAQKFSSVTRSINRDSPTTLMCAAQAYFLRAEGALRGWNMGGSAKQLYEDGIATSFAQYGIGSSVATAYINDDTSKPAGHTDPLVAEYSTPALSSITIKWDDNATNEQNLERIVTQQWIANYGACIESWTTFRRTGYPKLFPVLRNKSNGVISDEIQIRRMPFLTSEYTSNKAEVEKAVTLLGGPDNGATRLWWDIDKPNF